MKALNRRGFAGCAGVIAFAALLGNSLLWAYPPPEVVQKSFATAQDAAQALVKASAANDTATLLGLFGPDGKSIVEETNPAEGQRQRQHFAQMAGKKLDLVSEPGNPAKVTLTVGDEGWPFPVPLIEKDGRWLFDTAAGQEEILARRIGRHELTAIEICRGYVEAQQEYAQTHRAHGVPEYAQHILSAPGKQDGLYWEAAKGEPKPNVPKGFARAAAHMDPQQRRPYHGYYFRILTAQGPAAQGGALNYVLKDIMLGGFALAAWPAAYGDSGVQTFIVNHQGIVYEKDLGPDTDKLAQAITEFNPDKSWHPVPSEESATVY
jgi:hypothetical protein